MTKNHFRDIFVVNICLGGISMAGGQATELAGYSFHAKPKSLWRRIIFDFWPYFQAAKPDFILRVQRTGEASEQKRIKCYFKFATGDSTGKELTIPPLQTGETADLLISNVVLEFTADTLLVLPRDLVSRLPAAYETIYTFHTTPKVWLTLTLIAAVIAGAFAGFGTLLLITLFS